MRAIVPGSGVTVTDSIVVSMMAAVVPLSTNVISAVRSWRF